MGETSFTTLREEYRLRDVDNRELGRDEGKEIRTKFA